MASQNRRRSSLLGQHAVKEGIVFEPSKMPSELMKILPNATTTARNSASLQASRRSSNFGPIPEATPISEMKSNSKQAGAGASRIPSIQRPAPIPANRGGLISSISTSSSTSTSTNNGTNSAVRGRPTFGIPNSQMKNNVVSNLLESNKKQRSNSTIGNTALKNIRRSMSYDSHDWTRNMMTPNQPSNRSRSKSPNTRSVSSSMRWASQENEKGTIAKTLKPPASTDKRSLHIMTELVLEFLKAHGYNKQFQANQFSRISAVDLHQICKFLFEIMFGAKEFNVSRPEDLVVKIHDMTILLKYPGTIKKSDLKTPTVPTSWAYILTFLTWLCCRIKAWEQYKAARNVIFDEEEISLESYLGLFHRVCAGGSGYDFESDIEQELEYYKRKIEENYSAEFTEFKTKAESLAFRDEKRKTKLEIDHIPDPRTDLLEKRDANKAKLCDIDRRKKEIALELKKLENIEIISRQKEMLNSTLARKESELFEKREILSNQKMSKEEAQEMLYYIENIKRQKVAIVVINNSLRAQEEAKKHDLKNTEANFYETVSRFSLVELFNQSLVKLKLGVNLISKNPTTPNELKGWLQNLIKELRTISIAVQKMKRQLQQEISSGERDLERLNGEYALRLKKNEDLKRQQRSVDSGLNEKERNEESKIRSLKSEIERIEKDIRAGKEVNLGIYKKFDALIKGIEHLKKGIENGQARKIILDKKVEHKYSVLKNEEEFINLELEKMRIAFLISVNELLPDPDDKKGDQGEKRNGQ